MGSSTGQSKSKTIELAFAASPLSAQYYGVRILDWLARNQDNVSEWTDMYVIFKHFFNKK
jgi:hypothetical protein